MRIYRRKSVLFFSSLTLLFFFYVIPVQAALETIIDDASSLLGKAVQPTGLAGKSDVKALVGGLIQAALTLVGIIFFILMVYGGFVWMTARGNEENIEKARKMIIAAVIGIAIIVGAYAITSFIVGAAVKGAGVS